MSFIRLHNISHKTLNLLCNNIDALGTLKIKEIFDLLHNVVPQRCRHNVFDHTHLLLKSWHNLQAATIETI